MEAKIKKSLFQINAEYKQAIAKAKKYTPHQPSDDVAISIQHLSMIFKNAKTLKVAVDDLSFDVKKGSFHGFIGDNGAGKTTTIRSILGFYPSHYGMIYLNGVDSRSNKSKDIIGYIPEVAEFPKKLTVREYLIHFARMSNIPKDKIKSRVDELMRHYGFDKPEFNKSAAFMSSGQKKTVLLMQALLNDPDILIMDEPAANLDPTARIIFYESVKELNRQGKTIFISSHILLELERYIDSFTVLSHGKVLDSGLVKDKMAYGEYNTKLSLNDNDKIIPMFLKHNIKHKIVGDIIECNLSQKEQDIVLQEITRLGLKIKTFKENKLTLNELYFDAPEGD